MTAPELLREVTVDGRFKIYTPKDSTHEIIEEGSGIAFHVRKDCEALYLKWYPLPRWRWSLRSALKAEANRFLKRGILSVTDEIIGSHIDDGEVNGTLYVQLMVSVSKEHWWIARLIAKPRSKSYCLLHCHGDKEYMALATAVFCEFYLLP